MIAASSLASLPFRINFMKLGTASLSIEQSITISNTSDNECTANVGPHVHACALIHKITITYEEDETCSAANAEQKYSI